MANLMRSSAGTLLGVLSLSLLSVPLTGAEVITESEAAETGLPSNVEHVQVLPGDGEVTLTWDAATDDSGVEGYNVYTGLKSVSENGGSYTLGSSDAGDTTTYVVDHLTNGVTYYFAVKAYDEEGNESAEFSREVEATPEVSETGDFTAPTVNHVAAVSNTLVEVVFSEAVTLPADASSSFAVEASDGTAVEVIDAYLSEDPTTVYVVTDTQTAEAMYTLTASASITDQSGNPISSGTSDTGVFAGSSLEKTENDNTTTSDVASDDGFKVEEVDSSSTNELVLSFSQKVMVADPSAFTIQAADDATQTIEVLAVSVDSDDATQVTLVTEDMEAGFDYVLTLDESVLNEDGATLDKADQTIEFTAKTLELADVIAPEDVTDFLSSIVDETSVALSWTASVNSAGDLAKYLVYQSADGGASFGDPVTVASNSTSYDVTGLTPGATYTFKVTAVDESGNESEGVMTTVTLPEAGPELLLLVPLALAGAAVVGRKRRD
jgi:hypothetical protein